jgi:AraC-like DNA-binding protein
MGVSVPLSQLVVVAEWLDAAGGSSQALLAEAGLPRELLRGDPMSRVALAIQRRFFELVTERAEDPACLVRAALAAPAGAFCLAELPLLAASDLDQVEMCIRRAWQQPSMGLSTNVTRSQPDELSLTVYDLEPCPPRCRFLVGTWARLARELGMELRRLEMPLLSTEPLGVYEELCPQVSSGGAVLQLGLGQTPGSFPRRNRVTFSWLLEQAERMGGPLDLEGLVRQEIRLALHRGEPISIRSVAQAVALSTRTLQRRLLDDGVRFRSLVATERCAFAARLLQDTTISIKQVATRVGFQGTSSFDRAFQLWSGKTPGEWRGDTISAPGAPPGARGPSWAPPGRPSSG